MNYLTLARRNLVFYRRMNAAVCAGAAVATAVIVGALLVGDSVRYSLRKAALTRLGATRLALVNPHGFFPATLAERIAKRLGLSVVPVLRAAGGASNPDAGLSAGGAVIFGVDRDFRALAPGSAGAPYDLEGDAAVVGSELAQELNLSTNSTLVLRLQRPSALPPDIALADPAPPLPLRVRVAAIAGPADLGGFSLDANPLPPRNVFVARDTLARALSVAGKANLLLAAGAGGAGADAANEALAAAWQLADAGLALRAVPGRGQQELVSDNIFLPPQVADAALRAAPGAQGVLAYFVNAITRDGRQVPYSVAAAPGAPLVPPDMADDEVVLNSWAAEDLGARAGDAVKLAYYRLGPLRALAETAAVFRVHSVVPLAGAAADPSLMPPFPGLAEADSCRDWTPGIPVDLSRVRERDEQYWGQHRGTPKAFVTLRAAQALWGNPFGDLTAVRYTAADSNALAAAILRTLRPESAGLAFRDVRAEALRAAQPTTDFGSLFLGLSFFLLLAAALLLWLLFVFGVEQRARQIGTLVALGFTRRRILALLMAEGAVLAAGGAVAGTALGAAYAGAVVAALRTIWNGAVHTSALEAHVSARVLAAGAVAGAAVAVSAILAAAAPALRRAVRELHAGPLRSPSRAARGTRWLAAAAFAAILAAANIAARSNPTGPGAAGAFFAAGALLLGGWLGFCGLGLRRLHSAARSTPGAAAPFSRPALVWRNCTLRRSRSLAVIALLACGVFLVVAVSGSRRDAAREGAGLRSGSGGFALLGETALPITSDLGTPEGLRAYGIAGTAGLEAVVQMRTAGAEEASCLNLNRIERPRLLGVKPSALARPPRFDFAAQLSPEPGGWSGLECDPRADVIPGIADNTTILWGLGRRLGDTLEYVDEAGRPFKVRLVAGLKDSILQGSVIVHESVLLHRFPSSAASRFLLIATAQPARAAQALRASLQDSGLVLEQTDRRLAQLFSVQNTYLDVFLMLGGLGLLLGSAGLGLVVARNVLERRAELALLLAVGIERGTLSRLVLAEHFLLLVLGLGCGTAAAVVAVLPALSAGGNPFPWRGVVLLLAALLGGGLAWTGTAVRLALRGRLTAALREE